jgi:hypothetical protein
MRRPTETFSTNMANTICKAKPQATVFMRMARLLVENAYASASIDRSPRIPVKRPIVLLQL